MKSAMVASFDGTCSASVRRSRVAVWIRCRPDPTPEHMLIGTLCRTCVRPRRRPAHLQDVGLLQPRQLGGRHEGRCLVVGAQQPHQRLRDARVVHVRDQLAQVLLVVLYSGYTEPGVTSSVAVRIDGRGRPGMQRMTVRHRPAPSVPGEYDRVMTGVTVRFSE